MNRSARRFVGQALIVCYLLTVTGSSLLHEHHSRAMGLSRSNSSSPRHKQTPLSDGHCPACQFYAAQPDLTPAVQIACSTELAGTVVVRVLLLPAAEPWADLLARGPPMAA